MPIDLTKKRKTLKEDRKYPDYRTTIKYQQKVKKKEKEIKEFVK